MGKAFVILPKETTHRQSNLIVNQYRNNLQIENDNDEKKSQNSISRKDLSIGKMLHYKNNNGNIGKDINEKEHGQTLPNQITQHQPQNMHTIKFVKSERKKIFQVTSSEVLYV